MSREHECALAVVMMVSLANLSAWSSSEDAKNGPAGAIERRFATTVQPFLNRYCVSCHGAKKQEAALDLSRDTSVAAIVKNIGVWEQVLDRLHAEEMPPEKAKLHPKADERAAVVKWIRDLRHREAERTAGDPGVVLARRLSNAEYDYTIRDLAGVDIRPTREFPVDPANQAGFDNTGESLTMSPALLKKYLAAARHVADHVLFKPEGLVFAPYPVVTETDRDKYCVQRIIDFYKRHEVDYADYFQAAWKYQHRAKLGRLDATLADFAAEAKLSPRYLALVWSALSEPKATMGPLAAIHAAWAKKNGPDTFADVRDLVGRLRKPLKVDVKKLSVNGMGAISPHREFSGKMKRYERDLVD